MSGGTAIKPKERILPRRERPPSSRGISRFGSGAFLFLIGIGLIACAVGPKVPSAEPAPGIDVSALQREIVAKLAGAEEITPGLKIPDRAAVGNRAAARTFLTGLWAGLGFDVQFQDYGPEGRNIYAVLPATDLSPDWIVLGAHYDSARNCPGANDNASGAALVSAAAAAMKRGRPRTRNLVFVLFDEEERGLKGSRAFAQKLKDENKKVVAVITIDQMGWDADDDRAVELEIPYDGAVALFTEASGSLSRPVPVFSTMEPGSDHSAFRKLGFAAVGLTEEYRNGDTTPHFHRPADTSETVSFDYLKSSTDLVIAALRILVR